MPYIKREQREELEPELGALIQKMLSMPEFHSNGRAGILNYVITDMLDSCFGPLSNAKYRDYNEAIGMLECCKLEFYRKAAAPYEDLKEKENGKVLDGETRKPPKPAAVKITPSEMMVTKPTDGFDKIMDPGLVDEIYNIGFKGTDEIKTKKIISKHLSYIFNPELTQSITDCGKRELEKQPIPKCCVDEAIKGNPSFKGFVKPGVNIVLDKFAGLRTIIEFRLWVLCDGKLIKPYGISYDVVNIDESTGYLFRSNPFGYPIPRNAFENMKLDEILLFTDDEVEHMITNRINFKFMEASFEVGIQRFINTRGTDLVQSKSAKSSSITKVSKESVQSFTSKGKINITKRNLIFSVKVNLDTTIYIRANSISDADHIFDQIEPYKDGPRDYNVLFVSHFVDLDKDLKAEFLKKEISGTPEDSLYIIIKKVIGE